MDGSHSHSPEFGGFIRTIQFDELCDVATSLRGGLSCQLGSHTEGGENAIFELIFSDDVTWMARIPLPIHVSSPRN